MEERVGVELRIEDGVEERVTTKALTIAMMHNYYQDSVGTEESDLARFNDFSLYRDNTYLHDNRPATPLCKARRFP